MKSFNKYTINILKIFLCSTALMSTSAMAGTMGDLADKDWKKNLFIGVDGGYSLSLNSTNFSPYTNSNIGAYESVISIPGNTTFQHDIGNSGMIGGFLGYRVNENLSFNVNYDYRGWFSWQVPTNASLSSSINDLFYYVKDINIQTLFFNFTLTPNQDWEKLGPLRPYVSGGLGMAFNHVGTLTSVDLMNPATTNNIEGSSITSFSWNVGIGAEYLITQNLVYTLGYRFVEAGSIETSNNLYNSNGTYEVNPFKASPVLLNEIVTGLRWQFNT